MHHLNYRVEFNNSLAVVIQEGFAITSNTAVMSTVVKQLSSPIPYFVVDEVLCWKSPE